MDVKGGPPDGQVGCELPGNRQQKMVATPLWWTECGLQTSLGIKAPKRGLCGRLVLCDHRRAQNSKRSFRILLPQPVILWLLLINQ